MADLYLHGQKLDSVFELLGEKENDITRSIGWAFSHSPGLLKNMLAKVFPRAANLSVERISLQEYQKDSGITDVENVGPDVHVVIEAKRGWWPPAVEQLKLYAVRLKESKSKHRALVALAECSPEYARFCLPRDVAGIPVSYLSWKDVHNLSKITKGTHAEKRLLAQLRTYITRVVHMQNQESNLVYVVSLGAGIPD